MMLRQDALWQVRDMRNKAKQARQRKLTSDV